jgi:hypothetical protein
LSRTRDQTRCRRFHDLQSQAPKSTRLRKAERALVRSRRELSSARGPRQRSTRILSASPGKTGRQAPVRHATGRPSSPSYTVKDQGCRASPPDDRSVQPGRKRPYTTSPEILRQAFGDGSDTKRTPPITPRRAKCISVPVPIRRCLTGFLESACTFNM